MHPQKQRRHQGAEVFWSTVLLALPLAAAMVTNEYMGWWEGVAAFLVVGAVLGVAAHVFGPRAG